MNPFIASLIAALKRLAQEDVDIRADVTAAGYVTSAQLTAALATYATDAELAAAVAALVDASPAALDTLNELAAALGDDPNFATTVTNAIAARIAVSIVDAKGDLIVGTGADAVTRVPVGADGTVLTASAAAAAGVVWLPAAGRKTYASTAEVNAVLGTEEGIYRFANVAEVEAFFGAAGSAINTGMEAIFTTLQGDNFGSGYAPDAGGTSQQIALVQDGYGDVRWLRRARGWNTGTAQWDPWTAWVLNPIPNYRPSGSGSLWVGASTADGTGDTWKTMLNPTEPAGASANEADRWDSVAQAYTAWFTDASRSALEGGELRTKSAGFDFLGLLDAARTDVGTVAFAARSTANPSQQANRVEATAAAAGVNAVAGFSIPLGVVTRFGLLLHATFSMTGGATANTRLLCGLVATADLAAAMADNDPSAMQNFLAAGYGSADTEISVFQKATTTLAQGLSGQAPVTSSTAQLIDFRALVSPNSGLLRYLIAARNGNALVRATGSLASAPSNSLPLTFFLRASAGGTSATPKVALHRLRVGAGILSLGGF